MRFIVAALTTLAFSTPAFAAETWHPSKYGAADTIGAANNLSPEGAIRAAKLVKTGKVYALGVVTGPQTPVWPGRSYKVVVTPADDGSGAPLGANQVTSNDDVLLTHVGIGTQIDGFAHIGINHRHYNGVPGTEVLRPDGVAKFGTEKIPPAATRGVLLDMVKLFGKSPVSPGTAALEAIPFEDPAQPFIVHQTLLTKHGVHILENINTAELAADSATEFMFVLGVPRFQGTVQMVVNPVAVR